MAYTLQYYDLVLVAIIGSIALGGALGALTPLAMPIAIVVLGAVSVAFMGHAMFVNGPVDDVEDLTEEVELEDAPVAPENVPLLD
jgi:hypothetical protein